jgi:tryptophanyl-tRNA synthetase
VAKGLKEQSSGLFTYPVLMAADILLYQADIVPTGKDQKQHIEIARDIGEKFNAMYGEAFTLPEPHIPEDVAYIIGTDGEHKMSKSYGNVIEFFAEEAVLKKQVMSVRTDSTPLEEPKDPNKDAVFKLYSHFCTEEEKQSLAKKYRAGGYGYGDAKKLLFQKITEYFAPFRQKRIELKKDLSYVENVLIKGAKKAKLVAQKTMADVRKKVGLELM